MASKKLTLPSGATVTLRDPKTLLIKDRKAIMTATDGIEGDGAKTTALGDALLTMMIEDWSFDLILPSVKKDSLDQLTPQDYDFLSENISDIHEYLFPKLAKTDENEKDPKADTANSKDSNG